MSKLLPFASPATRREQASAWLSRLDRGLTTEETLELRRWLAEAAANRRELVRLAAIWDAMSTLTALADAFPLESRRSRRGLRAWLTRRAV